jgi:hypothetical protein
MRRYGLSASPHLAQDPDRVQARHERVSYLAVEAWLTELGLSATVAEQLASVVGSHHGVSPEDDQLHKLRRMSSLIGKGVWDQARRSILDRATTSVGGPDVLRALREVTLTKPALVLLTAIVIVADWIASNPDFFPLEPIATAQGPLTRPDDSTTIHRLEQAWTRLGLPPRWLAKPLDPDLDEVFRQRFRRPTATARPVQIAAV